MNKFQKTIQNNIFTSGLGLHSGKTINVALKPAPAQTGIWFKRVDQIKAAPVKAAPENVVSTTLATTLGQGESLVSTVEHLMASLSVLGVDNLFIEVDGPELPIFDGSAAVWVNLLQSAGVVTLNAPKLFYRVTEPFILQNGDKSIEVCPASSFSVEAHIDFTGAIGRHCFCYSNSEKAFISEISPARTFCNLKDVEEMKSHGLALGGSLENAVVVGDDGILNPEGLRFNNEFVRHKILDFIGDMAVAGLPVIGQFILKKPGHELNRQFLMAALAEPGLLELVDPVKAAENCKQRPAATGRWAIDSSAPLLAAI